MSDKRKYTFDSYNDAINADKKLKVNFSNRNVENISMTLEDSILQSAGIDNNIKKSSINKNKYKDSIFSDKQKVIFLEELSNHGVVRYACEKAKISRLTFYYNYQIDIEFRKLVDDAFILGAINIEDEAKIRAVNGIEENVYFRGAIVGTVRRFSDFLITFLLKGNFPYKYGDNRAEDHVDVDMFGQAKIKVDAAVKKTDNDINYTMLTDEQLKTLIQGDTIYNN